MEEQIAENLRQNIPQPTETTVADPVVSDPVETDAEFRLDDITSYKLSQHFGEQWTPTDVTANRQLNYIYEHIANRIGTSEYPFVVAKVNELSRMLGFSHTDNARYRLYQWLKLDQNRSRIELEMNNV